MMDVASELLLVGVGDMGRPYLHAARRLGLSVQVVERPSRLDALRDDADAAVVTRGSLEEHWVEAAAEAAARRPPHGVLAFSESQVMAAAMVADQFALPGPSLRASVASRNKAVQRALCSAYGVMQPEHLLTDALPGALDWARQRLPVVVKSLSGSGSSGVELVADQDALDVIAQGRSADGAVLVEAAVGGEEYSWEALVRDGRVWFANVTAKETTGPPHFVEVAHRSAADIPEELTAAAHELGRAVIHACGVRTGLVHLEFKAPDRCPTLIEFAVRTPGDHLMDLMCLTYGVDWFELVVRLAMGLPLPRRPDGPKRYAASCFVVPECGVVTEVSGLDEVRAHPSVLQADLHAELGARLPPARSSADRAGSAIVAADDRAELEKALAFVKSTLTVRTAPE